jgi:hypothetical protein
VVRPDEALEPEQLVPPVPVRQDGLALPIAGALDAEPGQAQPERPLVAALLEPAPVRRLARVRPESPGSAESRCCSLRIRSPGPC